ncbi:hypothetical protein [Adhaeribacter terrigena]|uniref:hypothetical protein n=1 Tax=Adhaeribacter terrigena TaxID=2793070 RepID=UPI00293DA0A7|nr:hypothetical protein [Adhaeribacter terrigena]
MYKSLAIGLLLFLGLATSVSAQGGEQSREFTWGINWNTNGGIIGGASIRMLRPVPDKEKWQQFWSLEIVEVKHPKENRLLGLDGDVFVLGKTNYLFVARPEYGREYSLFRKAPESGVQVNGVIGVGPSLGLMVPYYISYDYTEYSKGVQVGPTDIRVERYDPMGQHREFENIRGSAGFLTGANETDVNLGAHLRTALSFEFGRYQENIAGVETGFLFEAFNKKLVMLPAAENYKVFTTVYLTVYWGRRK